ncbi:MAG: hypothetical protein V1824_03700 [archaeon]
MLDKKKFENKKNNIAKLSILTIFLLIAFLLVLSGLLNYYFFDYKLNKNNLNSEIAISKCIKKCKEEISKGTMLENGPCISQEITSNWACDIANNPRIPIVDNSKENQCNSYNLGKVKHFVELTKNCELIKFG